MRDAGTVYSFHFNVCEFFHEVCNLMLRLYLPVLLLLGFAVLNAVLILGAAHLTVKAQPTAVKSQPYESGISPLGDARD